jgi:hypothetical protein
MVRQRNWLFGLPGGGAGISGASAMLTGEGELCCSGVRKILEVTLCCVVGDEGEG